MAESIIRKYYVHLIKVLPMNDVIFIAELYSADLLPGNLKEEVQSKLTAAEKADHFLQHGIKNDTENFNKLLTIMKSHNGDHLWKLAEKIQREITSVPSLLPAEQKVGLLDEVQKRLKTAYKCFCNSDHPHCYIQLALVRDEICDIRDKKLNEITRLTLQGHVDEILKIKEPLKRGLEDIFHYNNLSCPRLILIVGAPGIGKTTLANEICLQWAKDAEYFLSKEYDLVILIRLRAIQEATLQQVMIDAVGSEAAYNELLTKSHGNRCLIILEGLDEISAHWQQNDPVFSQLVGNPVFLCNANILVTSRPHACIHLHRDIKGYARTIEIVGFDKPQIKEYAELYFHNSNTAEKFMGQINNDSHFSSLCYVPLCLNMVLECFKYNNETLHTTLTELYQSFIISKANDSTYFKKTASLGTISDGDEQYFKNLSTVFSNVPNLLSKGALETMFFLSKLAYSSYIRWSTDKHFIKTDTQNNSEKNPKIIFTEKDLANCNITNLGNDACGLLKATNTLFATGNTAVYTFNHLSVQEYFCALYISLLPEDQQLQLFEHHITDHPHMWPFYAGITKLRSSNVLQYLQQYFLQDNQLEKISSIDHKTIKRNHNNCNYRTVIILNSIYEAQLLLNVCIYEVYSLFVDHCRLLPYDCISISYLSTIIPITHLFLRSCQIGDREVEILTRCEYLLSLKALDLSYNDITCKGMESVVKIIKSAANLTYFSSFRNPIGDDGMQLFSSLKFKHLVQLTIGLIDREMTEVITTCGLCECLKLNNSLQSLEISYNKIKDNGLTGLIHNLPNTLVQLIIPFCSFTYDGAVSIGNMLKVNQTLKHLQIAGNAIGDDGMSAIADALCVNTTLIQVVARTCNFNVKGAESIAKMLEINKTLKFLDISNNQIGDDGIIAVNCSIQTNTTLLELTAFRCELHCKGLQSVNEMLKVNKTLRKLNIAYNNAEDVAISEVVETFFKSNCTLNELNFGLDQFGEYQKTEDCFDKVYYEKFILTGIKPACCSKHVNLITFNDMNGQFVSQLRRHDQFEDGTIKDYSDDTEEWLMVDKSELRDDSLPIRIVFKK